MYEIVSHIDCGRLGGVPVKQEAVINTVRNPARAIEIATDLERTKTDPFTHYFVRPQAA